MISYKPPPPSSTPPGPPAGAWRPSLQEVSDPSTLLRTIQTIAERVDHLHLTTGNIQAQVDAANKGLASITPKAINDSISANGAAPLNLTGLIGQAYTPQVASVPSLSSAPNPNDPYSQSGVLVLINGTLYYNGDPVGNFLPTGSLGVTLVDTHANRPNYDPSTYPLGVLFFESDRTVLYINSGTYGSSTWNYLTGIMNATFANRPADLISTDLGFLFYATDQAVLYRWSGTAWSIFISATPTIQAGGPNGPTPPGTPVPGTAPTVTSLPLPSNPLSYFGSIVIYNGVPWTFVPPLSGAGDGFWQQIGGANQTISDTRANRSSYNPASYPPGTAYFETDTTLIYTVQFVLPTTALVWQFYSGSWTDVYANLPTLGLNDRWVVFNASDYIQSWVWNGTAWNFAPGSSSDYFLLVFPGITTLPPGLWGACDGSTWSVTQNDATLVSRTPAVVANQYIRR